MSKTWTAAVVLEELRVALRDALDAGAGEPNVNPEIGVTLGHDAMGAWFRLRGSTAGLRALLEALEGEA